MDDPKVGSDFAGKLLELGSQMLSLARDLKSAHDPIPSNDLVSSQITGQQSAFKFSSNWTEPGALSPATATSYQIKIPLPDPRLIRQVIRQRRLRGEFFDGSLFADPAWDILLDLTAARAEHKRVSVTSLCIAAGVPSTTALRWIQQLIDNGLLERTNDDRDRRRAFVSLSDKGADQVARFFEQLGSNGRFLL